VAGRTPERCFNQPAPSPADAGRVFRMRVSLARSLARSLAFAIFSGCDFKGSRLMNGRVSSPVGMNRAR